MLLCQRLDPYLRAELRRDADTKTRLFLEKRNQPPLETVLILGQAPKRHIVGQISSFVRLIPALQASASDPLLGDSCCCCCWDFSFF